MRLVAVLVVATALVVGVVPQFTHCKTGSTMGAAGPSAAAHGGSMTAAGSAATPSPAPMRCHWSARAALGVALPLVAAGVLLFFSRSRQARRAPAILVIVLGAVTILVPTALIGVCGVSSAECNTAMRPIMLAAGGLAVVIGLVALARNELRTDDGAVSTQAAG